MDIARFTLYYYWIEKDITINVYIYRYYYHNHSDIYALTEPMRCQLHYHHYDYFLGKDVQHNHLTLLHNILYRLSIEHFRSTVHTVRTVHLSQPNNIEHSYYPYLRT